MSGTPLVEGGGAPSAATPWYRTALLVLLTGALLAAGVVAALHLNGTLGLSLPPLPPRNVPVSTSGNLLLLATDEGGTPLPQAVLSVDGIPGRSGVALDGTCRLAVPPGDFTLRAVAPTAPGVDPPQYAPRAAALHVEPGLNGAGGEARVLVSIEAWSASATSWEAIATGVAALANGDTTVTITYSFMNPGVYVAAGPAGRTIVLEDYAPGGTADVDAVDFAGEVRAAFAEWVLAFAATFCPANGFGGTLSVIFAERFEPAVGAPSLFANYTPEAAGVGDIRIGMWAQGVTGRVLAYAYGPDNAGSIAGDMLFNASVDWKMDTAGPAVPAYSVLRTAVHELGHSWGLLHSASSDDVMYPFVSTGATYAAQFPQGLATSETLISGLLGIYAPLQAAARAAARDEALAATATWPQ